MWKWLWNFRVLSTYTFLKSRKMMGFRKSLGPRWLSLLGRSKQTKLKLLEWTRCRPDRQTSENDHRHNRGRDQTEGALLISINPTLQRRCPGIFLETQSRASPFWIPSGFFRIIFVQHWNQGSAGQILFNKKTQLRYNLCGDIFKNRKHIGMWNWSSRFPLLFHPVSFALPLPQLLFSFDLVSPSSIHSRSLPCDISAFYFSFFNRSWAYQNKRRVLMRKRHRTSDWIRHITLFCAVWFSVLTSECRTSFFYRIKFRRLCFHLLFMYRISALSWFFEFPTWARFRRVSAHLAVFSIQELKHFADFLSLACFSFP